MKICNLINNVFLWGPTSDTLKIGAAVNFPFVLQCWNSQEIYWMIYSTTVNHKYLGLTTAFFEYAHFNKHLSTSYAYLPFLTLWGLCHLSGCKSKTESSDNCNSCRDILLMNSKLNYEEVFFLTFSLNVKKT